MNNRIVTSLCVLCASLCAVQMASAQGNLTPPGTPAPTMKSLDQIEPRTAITSAPYTISSPGSYYLTTNINVTSGNAITINANNVTLDLNGFTISSTQASPTGTGISLGSSVSDITILNGHIRGGVTYSGGNYTGSGFAYGIFYPFPNIPENVRVAGVSVSGCLNDGINLGFPNSTIIESCTVQTVGGYGIVAASVSHSAAWQCGNTAIIVNIASDCYASSTGAQGLSAVSANNCYGTSQLGWGLFAYATANNCYGTTVSGSYGLISYYAANTCYGFANGSGDGLDADTANDCYGESTGNGSGLYAYSNATGSDGYSGGSGYGLYAYNANNCHGVSSNGTGVYAVDIAIGCYGFSPSGTGLRAFIANSSDGSSFNVTHKYNMP
jgi:hypothetical protein